MTRATSTPAEIDWRLAEQHFQGTPAQVSADLEELILTLVACRQSLEVTRARPEPAAPPALWRRLFAVLGLAVAITVAAPAAAGAQAQQPDADPARPAGCRRLLGA